MFRKAKQSDIKAIAEIYKDIHIQEDTGKVTIGWHTDVYPIEATAQKGLNDDELYVFQDDDGNILASAIINQKQVSEYKYGNWKYDAKDDEVMVLHTLVVKPSASKMGIGRSFVSFYENLAKQNGCKALRIDTNAKNIVARKMYNTLGYQEVGIIPCIFNGIQDVQLVLLEKFI